MFFQLGLVHEEDNIAQASEYSRGFKCSLSSHVGHSAFLHLDCISILGSNEQGVREIGYARVELMKTFK